MSQTKQRVEINGLNHDQQGQDSICYNEGAGAKKVLPVGPVLQGLGVLSAATRVEVGAQMAFWSATAGLLVSVGTTAGLTLGALGSVNTFPVKANDYTYICVGENDFVITSAGVYAFIITDTTALRDR